MVPFLNIVMVSLFEFESVMNEEVPGHYDVRLTPQQILHIVFCPKKKRAFYTRGFSIWAGKSI